MFVETLCKHLACKDRTTYACNEMRVCNVEYTIKNSSILGRINETVLSSQSLKVFYTFKRMCFADHVKWNIK